MAEKVSTVGKFLIVGAINTAVSYGIFVALVAFVPYALAYSFAYACGIAVSFFLGSYFVFERRPTVRSAFAFPFVYVLQYALSLLGLYVLVDVGAMKEWVALLIILAITTPMTFLLSRFVVVQFAGRSK